MNAEERDTVRALIDHAKRERLVRANRAAPVASLATVYYLPTAAQAYPPDPLEIRPRPAPAPVPTVGRCMFCGGRTRSDVCRAHEDLVA